MKRTQIIYDDTGVAVGFKTTGTDERKLTTYGYQGRHGAKIACPGCGEMNKASGVDKLGWKRCHFCGRNCRFTK